MDRCSVRNLRLIGFVSLLLLFSLLIALPWSTAQTEPWASTSDNLNGLALLSSSNGWAVGNAGTIEHFDGSSWNLIPSGTAADLFGVSFGPPTAPNANAGFAVGGSGGAAVALFWSGFSWSLIMTGLSGPDAKKLSAVSAVSSTDAWAVDSVSGAFWHWSGTAGLGGGWNEISSAAGGLNSVFMISSSEGWAVGIGGFIYHYTGGGWTLFTTVGTTLNSIFMLNQNDGWAVGNGGVIFHYSSGTWTGPISPGPTGQNLNSVFMISSSEGWAVGASGTALHYVNGAWGFVQNLSGITQNLNAVSFSGGTGFAVGDVGVIVFLGSQTPQGVIGSTLESVFLSNGGDGWIVGCSTGGCGTGTGEPTILHWIGSSFVRGSASAATTDLYSVFMVSPSEGWAVGGMGSTPAILHYTGGSWTQVTAPPVSVVLRSVFMMDSNTGWAVGGSGAILRESGGSWGTVSSPTSNTLRSVFMVGASDGWAVGDGGVILRYQSGQWVNYPSPTGTQLNAVSLLDSTHGWAVGAGGTIIHYDGLTWGAVASGNSMNLNAVAQVNPQSALAVGDSATFLQWTGVAWYQTTPSPPLSGSPNLNSIFTLSDGSGVIVGAPPASGAQGTVLRVSIPVPELANPQLLFAAVLIITLGSIAIRRRRIE